jgi:ArsR family transcriptional regulator, lead/cadmium/zinc/bismuth-responsive transcriptional repressor
MPKTMEDRCEVYYLDEEKVKQAQLNLVDGLTSTLMSQIFRALSDPSRVRIVSALVAGELCVCDIAASVGMSQSAVSHQLRALRDANLVKFRKVGRKAYYGLESDHIAALFADSLKHVQA